MITFEIFALALWLTPVVAYYLVLPTVGLLKRISA